MDIINKIEGVSQNKSAKLAPDQKFENFQNLPTASLLEPYKSIAL
jgi:hypothetical protein